MLTIYQKTPFHIFGLIYPLILASAGTHVSSPADDLWQQYIISLPLDSAEFHVATGLSHAFGGEKIDLQSSCEHLVAACQRDYIHAQLLYRRIAEALLSVSCYRENLFNEFISSSPLELMRIRPGLFYQLEKLETAYPDNFLAHLVRFAEQASWSQAVYAKVCQGFGLEMQIWDFMACLVSPTEFSPVRNSAIEEFMTFQMETLTELKEDKSDSYVEENVALISLLMAISILFGDPEMTLLQSLCGFLTKIRFPLYFCFSGMMDSQLISPLELACRVGNANAVRVLLSFAGDEQTRSSLNRHRGKSGHIPLHFLFTFPNDCAEELCHLLLVGIEPKDMKMVANYESNHSPCRLSGTPLDYSLRVGSLTATRLLWEGLYLGKPGFLGTISLDPDGRKQNYFSLSSMGKGRGQVLFEYEPSFMALLYKS